MMIDIERITPEIVHALTPLDPDKIILYGSYAYGTPDGESDIDLFLIKKGLSEASFRHYSRQARLKLYSLLERYGIAFDVISRSDAFTRKRQDPFYAEEIMKKGRVLYAK